MTVSIDPFDMVVFAAVAREESFTRAALQLGLTKQAVSLKVARLETGLGVRLLERTTRSVRPTDAGARYAERCAVIASDIEAANHEVQETQVEPTGRLRVSAPFLFGRRFLGPVVAGFMARWPKVAVEVLLSDRRVDLVEEGIDLAVRIGPLEESSLISRRIGEAPVHLVASPRLVRRLGTPTLKTLPALPLVGIRATERWRFADVELKVTPRLVVNDLELACDAAIAGVGLAYVPALVCGPAVKRGALRVLLDESPPPSRPVLVMLPGRRHLAPGVRLFIDALAASTGVLGARSPRRAATGRSASPGSG